MFDKKHYEKLLQETLIKKGYLPKPSFDERLQDIINDSFDLTWKKMEFSDYSLNDILDLSEEEFIEYEKCQPDYITSLPGDLRSTDPNLLRERLTEIENRIEALDKEREETDAQFEDTQNRIDELNSRNEELQKNLNDYSDKVQSTNEQLDQLQDEGLEESSDVLLGWEELLEDRTEGPFPSGYDWLVSGMENLGNQFNNKGILSSEEAEAIRELADGVEEYLPIHDTGWSDFEDDYNERAMSLSDDLRALADKYDVNKHPLGDALLELNNTRRDDVPKWESEIENNNNEIKEQEKHLNELGRLARKQETTHVNLGINHNQTTNRLEQLQKNE